MRFGHFPENVTTSPQLRVARYPLIESAYRKYNVTIMRFGFAAPPVAGHLNPMIALAAHLKSRGHEAVFFNFLDTEPRFREVNMPFLSYGAERFPSGDLARRTSHLS